MRAILSRRQFLGLSGAALGAMLLPGGASLAAGQPEQPKSLIVYFTRSGHTKSVANDIHKKMGGDLVEIEVVNPYPADYHETTEVAKKEQKENARPPIKTRIPNLDQYDVIFLGYPNWWSSMPMPVYTFIEENKLDGKTIAPFVTHGGGGLGHSIEDLKKLAPHSKILKPLAVSGNIADRAEHDVLNWLEGLGPALIETTTGNTKIYPDGAY